MRALRENLTNTNYNDYTLLKSIEFNNEEIFKIIERILGIKEFVFLYNENTDSENIKKAIESNECIVYIMGGRQKKDDVVTILRKYVNVKSSKVFNKKIGLWLIEFI